MGAVIANKIQLGRPHLMSLHARGGLLALGLWFAAWVAAELQVWKVQIRDRRFTYKPRWLWRSDMHRLLGSLTLVVQLAVVGAGVSAAWGRRTLGLTGVLCIDAALCALAAIELKSRTP